MAFDNLFFGRRIRQNHALEHATITILSRMVPTLNVSARSSSDGFIIFGDVDLGYLRRALDEALARLQAGEAELAIHPNCGTNLSVGLLVVALGTMLAMASSQPRTRVATAAAATVTGWATARPVGEYVQKHFTTLPDLAGVRVTEIERKHVLGFTFISVRTVQE
jgi:predicted phage tail protein